MNSDSDELFRRLHELIALKLDGAAAPEGGVELQRLLSSDAELRALYVEYVQDTASLRWSFAHTTVPVEDDRSAETDSRATLQSVDGDQSRSRRRIARWLRSAAALAASLMIAGIAYYWAFRPGEAPAGSVATITRTIDARWEHGGEYAELARLNVGENVSLGSGQMELIFDTGVEVVVIGPAQFQISSAESIYSSRGTISARVGASGVGFTIDTPAARVIDLGTAFGVAINDDGGADAAQRTIEFELFHFDGCAIGQFIANQAEKFFADVFGSKKLFALVGDLVLAEQQFIVRQMLAGFGEKIVELTTLGGADRNDGSKSIVSGQFGENGQELVLFLDLVNLVNRQNDRAFCRQKLDDRHVSGIKMFRIDNQHNDIDFGQSLRHAAIHRPVQGIGVFGLKTGGIDKHVLGIRLGSGHGQDTHDAMPGRLCLARNYADFLADQAI